jgi:1-phosphofructokinase family hexose kinase
MADAKIVCLSANPAMDRRLRMSSFTAGTINRAKTALGFAGGKAAHVAMAARAMGASVVWAGFLGGAIGQECAREVENLGIEVVSISTAASTRVNLEIIEDSGRVTEILEPAAGLTRDEKDRLLRLCSQQLRASWKGGLLVISGSLPADLDCGFYVSLAEIAHAAGTKVFIDTSREALRESLQANPEFVKPNRTEAEALVARSLQSAEDAVAAAREVIASGAASAAITLGSEGIVWVEHETGLAWSARPPVMDVISTVGCGDATLAGFALAASQGTCGEQAIRLAAACGAANCVAFAPGRIEESRVLELLPRIEVRQLAF